ncbi:MAG: HDIG domain-containing metalloprotein [bacterium]
MFSFIRRLKRRLKRVLKVKSDSRQLPRPTFQSRLRKAAMLLVFSALVGLLYPGEDLFNPLDMPRRGEISLQDVVAPFPITVYKSDRELSDEMDVVRRSNPIVLDADTAVMPNVLTRLSQYAALIDSLKGVRDRDSTVSADTLMSRVAARFVLLPAGVIEKSLKSRGMAAVVAALADIFRNRVYQIGILPDRNALSESPNKTVLVRRGDSETIYPRQQVMSIADANVRLLGALNAVADSMKLDVEFAYTLGRSFMRTDLRTNLMETELRLEADLAAISNVSEVVQMGEIIARSGTRVNARQHRILQELATILRAEAAREGPLSVVLPVVVRVILILAVFSTLYLFLYHFRREIYRSNPRLLALFLVFALQLFLTYLAVRGDLSTYLYPVALLPIMVTILYDTEVGLLSAVVLAMFLGIMHRFDFTLTLMTITVGTTASFAARRVRRRSQFFKIGLSTGVAYVLFILLVENMKFVQVDEIAVEVGYGLVNGLVVTMLTIGLLPLFESLFGITTDITLLELSDMNHPLLKRLAIEAPGTYQHSLVVGNLCETAAEAIGGNSLLARVGAYYHDIGKIEIPEYFVENQLSVKSKHEDLSASMSSLILSSHVKRGRWLGEEFDIPDDVLNFIEEHHGTMLMSYFYNKAIEQGVDPEIADKLRYPGPKPQIRETGIAMVADAVEAASRTLENPKPARINSLIQRIINDRFQSGELDECPLTLRDLARIKAAFAQVLTAAFHHRVVYPTKSAEETRRR